MAGKRDKPLTREGEPSQRTDEGLEIPVPTRREFFGALKKAAKKNLGREKPSRPDPEKP